MEAAFIDIGKGRNAVLYAGEVNWSALGHKDGQPRKIESVLSSGQSVLVQVTKDPVGHKGARLTSQISLAGRFLVYVPDGTTSGISRKLPDTERTRLKTLLKEIVPDTAGVIVRTAAEGASEDELTRDVERLKARWEDIEAKAKGKSPQALYAEPDLTLKVVRDLFTEDFKKLVVEGEDAWETVQQYVAHVAPDLEDRLERYEGERGCLLDVPDRRADRQGARPQGVAALGRLADHRPHRGDDRRRRQHREVHRLRRQPRGDGHQEQPRGGRGDRPPAPAARHRRHHRRRLHRHGAGVQPGPGPAPAGGVPRPGPDPPPGRRGHLARPGADDPQADRHRPARGVLGELRGLPGPRRHPPGRPRRAQEVRRRLRGEAVAEARVAARSRGRQPWRRQRCPEDPAVAEGRRGDGPARDPGADGRRVGSSPSRPRPRRRSPRCPKPRRPSRPRRPRPAAVEPAEAPNRQRSTPSRPAPQAPARPSPPRAEPEPAAPKAEPEKPKVVTRTRRRSASRPAGPPTAAPAGTPSPRPRRRRTRGGAGRQRTGRRDRRHRAGGARHRRRRAGHRRVADARSSTCRSRRRGPASADRAARLRFAGRAPHPYY